MQAVRPGSHDDTIEPSRSYHLFSRITHFSEERSIAAERGESLVTLPWRAISQHAAGETADPGGYQANKSGESILMGRTCQTLSLIGSPVQGTAPLRYVGTFEVNVDRVEEQTHGDFGNRLRLD